DDGKTIHVVPPWSVMSVVDGPTRLPSARPMPIPAPTSSFSDPITRCPLPFNAQATLEGSPHPWHDLGRQQLDCFEIGSFELDDEVLCPSFNHRVVILDKLIWRA